MAASHIKTYISYIDDDDGDKEPALIITAKGRHKAAVIALSKAWAYRSETYLIQKAKEFAIHIGLGDTWFETRNMCDAIMDGLDALCMALEYQMTGRQDAQKHKPSGDVVSINVDGKLVNEIEL